MKAKILCKWILISLLGLFLVGCGNKKVDDYISTMSEYVSQIETIGKKIDTLTVSENNAPGIFISYIDEMNQIMIQMSSLSAPKGYETLNNLASSASSSMTAASGFYAQAYSEGTYDTLQGQQARIKYEAAMSYIQIMGSVLSGSTPSGNEIQVVYD